MLSSASRSGFEADWGKILSLEAHWLFKAVVGGVDQMLPLDSFDSIRIPSIPAKIQPRSYDRGCDKIRAFRFFRLHFARVLRITHTNSNQPERTKEIDPLTKSNSIYRTNHTKKPNPFLSVFFSSTTAKPLPNKYKPTMTNPWSETPNLQQYAAASASVVVVTPPNNNNDNNNNNQNDGGRPMLFCGSNTIYKANGTVESLGFSTTTTTLGNHKDNNANNNCHAMAVALRWLKVIEEATQCLRDRVSQQPNSGPKKNRCVQIIDCTEHSLLYLMKLEEVLGAVESQWDGSPQMDPPVFVPWTRKLKNSHNKSNKKKKNRSGRCRLGKTTTTKNQSPTSVMAINHENGDEETPGTMTTTMPGLGASNDNRFAPIQDDDDDDDDDEEEEEEDEKKDEATAVTVSPFSESSTTNAKDNTNDYFVDNDPDAHNTLLLEKNSHDHDHDHDLEEAGDVPTLNRIAHFPIGDPMSMRRIVIRIVTAQSELFAYQACANRRQQKWAEGARNCHAGLWKIHQGLNLADSEISRCLAKRGGGDWLHLDLERQSLMEDASIVEVAVKSLTEERDSFLQKALIKKHQLIRKLEKEYIGRTLAKSHLGPRWYNNPKPQNNRVRERAEHEQQLQDVQTALDHLIQLDTRALNISTGKLKLRLQPTKNMGKRSSSAAALARKNHRHRHNKRRPVYFMGDRVDLENYPDPSLYGWKFTGSYCEQDERVEYFEKQDILLDWHFSTAKLGLSWKHLSRQGTLPIFQSTDAVPAEVYLEIIQSDKAWEVVSHYYKK